MGPCPRPAAVAMPTTRAGSERKTKLVDPLSVLTSGAASPAPAAWGLCCARGGSAGGLPGRSGMVRAVDHSLDADAQAQATTPSASQAAVTHSPRGCRCGDGGRCRAGRLGHGRRQRWDLDPGGHHDGWEDRVGSEGGSLAACWSGRAPDGNARGAGAGRCGGFGEGRRDAAWRLDRRRHLAHRRAYRDTVRGPRRRRATDRSARHGGGAAREQCLFVRRGHRFEHSERRDTPDSGGRRVSRPRRAVACAELGSVGRRDRGHRLCRWRLHRLGLAGHDRRVAAGQRATNRCASALRSSVRRGRSGGRAARDRRWLARERLGERGRPRLPARLDDGRPDRPPPRTDDPRGRGHVGRHRLRDRRPRS